MTALDALQTPVLLIDLDQVRANIDRMLACVGGDAARWRPHVKTSKIPEVLDLVVAAGVRSFKCATTREADVLLGRATQPIDLLVAMAHHGPNRARIAALAAAHPQHRLSLLTEDPDHARTTPAELGLFIDLNPGYHRTGIPLDDRDRIRATIDACGERLRGLHYYDGHLHDGTLAQRRAQCDAVYGAFVALVDELAAGSAGDLELITSGTPTFPLALEYRGFAGRHHTVSPGTVVYWDERSAELDIAGFAPAATVLATVISRPAAHRVTCDAGSKAIDAAAGDPCARAVDWPNLEARTPSEEHLPLHVDGGDAPPLGSRIRLVPRHVCPTVNLAERAVLLEQGRVREIVAVAARAHEV